MRSDMRVLTDWNLDSGRNALALVEFITAPINSGKMEKMVFKERKNGVWHPGKWFGVFKHPINI